VATNALVSPASSPTPALDLDTATFLVMGRHACNG